MSLTRFRPFFDECNKRKTLQKLLQGTSLVGIKLFGTKSGGKDPGGGKVGHLH